MQGWIKLYRKLTEWGWYHDVNTRITFIHLLITVNHKDKMYEGKLIKRGSRLVSNKKLAEEIGLTENELRTAIKHLELTGEINKQSTSRNTLITVVNYDCYQATSQTDNEQITNKSQTDNEQITTNKNEKNDKNLKNERVQYARTRTQDINSKSSYGKFNNVLLTDDEYNLLIEQFGNPEQLIKRLDEYKEQSGKQYNSDYMAIRKWVVEAVKEDEAKKPPIDETYNIDEINRKAMLNDNYEI